LGGTTGLDGEGGLPADRGKRGKKERRDTYGRVVKRREGGYHWMSGSWQEWSERRDQWMASLYTSRMFLDAGMNGFNNLKKFTVKKTGRCKRETASKQGRKPMETKGAAGKFSSFSRSGGRESADVALRGRARER